MKYESKNSGLLAVGMVKTGDKIIIIEDAYSTFNEAKQTTYWNAKVQLPDGTHKLAGLFESVCDAFAAKWGDETSAWTGHTVVIEIKTSKSGNQYISMAPTDDPIVDVEKMRVEKFKKDVAEQEAKNAQQAPPAGVEYPTEQISPEDIPF